MPLHVEWMLYHLFRGEIIMEALKKINNGHTQSDREKFEDGMKMLTIQLQTIEQSLTNAINKDIQKQIQHQHQEIMYIQNALLSSRPPLSLD